MPGRNSHSWELILAGMTATFLAGALWWQGDILGVAGAKPAAELLIVAILFVLYPDVDCRRWTWRLLFVLALATLALVFTWIAVFAWGRTRFVDIHSVETPIILVTLLGGVVITPIFEEKVVRDLLLRGLNQMAGPVISTLLVSLAFALAHHGSMVWTFIVSISLCVMALRWRVSTLQRAVVHGLMNLLIYLWYGTYGYGLFDVQ